MITTNTTFKQAFNQAQLTLASEQTKPKHVFKSKAMKHLNSKRKSVTLEYHSREGYRGAILSTSTEVLTKVTREFRGDQYATLKALSSASYLKPFGLAPWYPQVQDAKHILRATQGF